MSDPGYLSVTPADVLYSADYLDTLGVRASTERRALTTELSGNTTAWQDGAAPGYTGFIEVVRKQADRISTEVGEVAAKLRDAAHAYVDNEHRSAESLRYTPSDM